MSDQVTVTLSIAPDRIRFNTNLLRHLADALDGGEVTRETPEFTPHDVSASMRVPFNKGYKPVPISEVQEEQVFALGKRLPTTAKPQVDELDKAFKEQMSKIATSPMIKLIEKPKRKRRTKAEIEAARLEAEKEMVEPAVDTSDIKTLDELEDVSEVEIEDSIIDVQAIRAKLSLENDVIPALQKFVAARGKDEAKTIIAKFKVKSIRDVPPEQFPELIKAFNA